MSFDAYVKGILSEVTDTERIGSQELPGGWENWDDHGRRRDLCRYCNRPHDFNDCEAPAGKPGKGLIGPWFMSQTGYKTFVGPVEGR